MKKVKKINSAYGETLAKWYLRFNGYFTVENFIVHAGDDTSKISKNTIGNHTETDILAIRYKFSKEETGKLCIQNDPKILNKENTLIDFVIVEVKTGKQKKPNKIWIQKNIFVIEYILRFAGFIESDETLTLVAKEIADKGVYHDLENRYSVRLVLISEMKADFHWSHLTNIIFDDIIDFLVNIRGQCWINEDIGIASIHGQWDKIINDIFTIANNHLINIEIRKNEIKYLIQKE